MRRLLSLAFVSALAVAGLTACATTPPPPPPPPPPSGGDVGTPREQVEPGVIGQACIGARQRSRLEFAEFGRLLQSEQTQAHLKSMMAQR